ncbi:MAG: hypothetical protein M3680_09200 [Myxococcota bacterium]|nr:hypothetical protein [Myxococcota bacterium]
MSRRSTVLCLVVAGCGRVGFAPPDDAPIVTDTAACPPTYQVSLASSTSRYRVISADALVSVHHADCRADSATGTHLVALDDRQETDELDVVLQTVPAPVLGRFYVGLVQLQGSASLATGWVGITGRPLDPTLWNAGEPDDLDDIENAREQLAVIDASGRLVDVSGTNPYGAVCECDGLPVDPAVEANIP